ncbi:MAG: SGNH/GDSL hydrolase family protein [Proteobacteria bacterium]|nr:SGNH/GDSL hydrolase family protein [Pseudomonadota bacterium]
MSIKKFFQNIALLVASIAFVALFLEALLRFFPVNNGFNFVSVNAEQPVFHAFPNRIVTTSLGWDFFNSRKVQINNVGFRNDQNYTSESSLPLIAVIGDSYVEAVQVDYKDTLYGQLAQKLGENMRVYSFGFSGAPLSQYLAWAQYATQTFKADYLTFVIISNDFDESLNRLSPRKGYLLYEQCEEERIYCLKRQDYQTSPYKSIIEVSALARYLIFNLQVGEIKSKLTAWLNNEKETFIGNVKAEADSEHLREAKIAVDLFFTDLPKYTNLPTHKINFAIDGRFYDDDDIPFEKSYFGEMRRYFMEHASARNYNIIDMKPIFRNHFKKHGKRFDSIRDAHWNELGHTLVANALYELYCDLVSTGEKLE